MSWVRVCVCSPVNYTMAKTFTLLSLIVLTSKKRLILLVPYQIEHTHNDAMRNKKRYSVKINLTTRFSAISSSGFAFYVVALKKNQRERARERLFEFAATKSVSFFRGFYQ